MATPKSTTPPTTGFQRRRRARHLRAAVYWELTDRRHYPPSPGTGLTIISPVPYPFVPPKKLPGPSDDDTEVMNLDGTIDLDDSDDAREDDKERCHENGYPVASSPTFKKHARTAEDQANDTELAHHLNALDLDADTRKSHHLTAKHLDRKARIRNSKTVRGFKFPQPPVGRVQKDKELNMYQLSKWAGRDAEKKKVVVKLLHDRGKDRTEGLSNRF